MTTPAPMTDKQLRCERTLSLMRELARRHDRKAFIVVVGDVERDGYDSLLYAPDAAEDREVNWLRDQALGVVREAAAGCGA